MNELMETNMAVAFEPTQTAAAANDSMHSHYHLIICGLCGAQERPIGPHKTECPNCDDYIY